jgi:hypothetical protein
MQVNESSKYLLVFCAEYQPVVEEWMVWSWWMICCCYLLVKWLLLACLPFSSWFSSWCLPFSSWSAPGGLPFSSWSGLLHLATFFSFQGINPLI